jgi:hypothetical protein
VPLLQGFDNTQSSDAAVLLNIHPEPALLLLLLLMMMMMMMTTVVQQQLNNQ